MSRGDVKVEVRSRRKDIPAMAVRELLGKRPSPLALCNISKGNVGG
jgi:hypothetical protein